MSVSAKTMQEIADRAGVSKMSVSRVLGNKPYVSKELREKVLKVAREIGYRPNPFVMTLMANLRLHRENSLGAVLAFLVRADRPEDARTEHFIGAYEAAEEQGYKLEQFVIGSAGLKPSRINNILLARNIRGVVIAPLPEGHGQFDHDWSQFCTVVIEYTFITPAFDRVVHDSYTSMRTILAECRSRGFCRIGLLFSRNAHERTEGLNEAAYWMEQKENDLLEAIPPLCLEQWDDGTVTKWLDTQKPEVIVVSSFYLTLLKKLLDKLGIGIPDDISIINVNTVDPTNKQLLIPTGIRQNHAMIGATAVRLLIDKIKRNESGIPQYPRTTIIPGLWVPGETLRDKPKSSR
jgi:DNA-binding LacI/PurR family transcriptional regulator